MSAAGKSPKKMKFFPSEGLTGHWIRQGLSRPCTVCSAKKGKMCDKAGVKGLHRNRLYPNEKA